MSTAEIRAHRIYESMNLNKIDDDVKRHLMILMLSVPTTERTKSVSSAMNSLSGAWKDDGMTAEKEIREIYEGRTTGKTRTLVDL